MRTRRQFHKIHLWFSLLVGALFIATCATGSALVFKDEIDAALNPALFAATGDGGDIGFDRAAEIARRAFPDDRVISLIAPAGGGGVYQAMLDDGNSNIGEINESPLGVYIEPGSGKILGNRRPNESFAGCVRRFHTSLFAGDFGKTIVGLGGLALLLVLASGIYLWLPGWKSMRLAFTVRRKRGFFLLNYDLHKVVGVFTAPLLAFVVAGGVLLVFNGFANSAIHFLFFEAAASHEPAPEIIKSRPVNSNTAPTVSLTLDQYRRLAEEAIPNSSVTSITLPQEPSDPGVVILKFPNDARPLGSGKVWLDRYSGAILARVNPRRLSTADNFYRSWRNALHSGYYGNNLLRALYVIIGAVPFIMMLTGLAVWRRKRRSVAASGERQRRLRKSANR